MLVLIIASLLGSLIVWWFVLNTFKLRSIRGPFIARYTDLWRLLKVHQGNMHNVYLELHQKYGSLVRVGPNCFSISDPEALAAVYNISDKLPKVWEPSAFHRALDVLQYDAGGLGSPTSTRLSRELSQGKSTPIFSIPPTRHSTPISESPFPGPTP